MNEKIINALQKQMEINIETIKFLNRIIFEMNVDLDVFTVLNDKLCNLLDEVVKLKNEVKELQNN